MPVNKQMSNKEWKQLNLPKEKEERKKGVTIRGGQRPGRNTLCPCMSGLKYKACHGLKVVKQKENETLRGLVTEGSGE